MPVMLFEVVILAVCLIPLAYPAYLTARDARKRKAHLTPPSKRP